MGAPFWSDIEREYFLNKVLPRSCFVNGRFEEGGIDLADLAKEMQEDLDKNGESRRKYDKEILYQHWYQKVRPSLSGTTNVQNPENEPEASPAGNTSTRRKATLNKQSAGTKALIEKNEIEPLSVTGDDTVDEHEGESPRPTHETTGQRSNLVSSSARALSRSEANIKQAAALSTLSPESVAAKKRARTDIRCNSEEENSIAKRLRVRSYIEDGREYDDTSDSDSVITPPGKESGEATPMLLASRKVTPDSRDPSVALPIPQPSPIQESATRRQQSTTNVANSAVYQSPYPRPLFNRDTAPNPLCPTEKPSKAQERQSAARSIPLQVRQEPIAQASTSFRVPVHVPNRDRAAPTLNTHSQINSRRPQFPVPHPVHSARSGHHPGQLIQTFAAHQPQQNTQRTGRPHPNVAARPSGPSVPSANNNIPTHAASRLGPVTINGTLMLPSCPCCHRGF